MRPEEREELLAAHALGALSGPEADDVEALVRRDAGAARQLAVYREIGDLLGVETPLRPVDPALLERMMRSARRMRSLDVRRFSVPRSPAIVVSLVVVAVVGGLVGARLDGDVPLERGGAWPPPFAYQDADIDSGEVVIELRVWQHVEDPWDVRIQARPKGW